MINNARNFSQDLRDRVLVADQIDAVQHPLVKQAIAQVLTDNSMETPYGSTFGEGGGDIR